MCFYYVYQNYCYDCIACIFKKGLDIHKSNGLLFQTAFEAAVQARYPFFFLCGGFPWRPIYTTFIALALFETALHPQNGKILISYVSPEWWYLLLVYLWLQPFPPTKKVWFNFDYLVLDDCVRVWLWMQPFFPKKKSCGNFDDLVLNDGCDPVPTWVFGAVSK